MTSIGQNQDKVDGDEHASSGGAEERGPCPDLGQAGRDIGGAMEGGSPCEEAGNAGEDPGIADAKSLNEGPGMEPTTPSAEKKHSTQKGVSPSTEGEVREGGVGGEEGREEGGRTAPLTQQDQYNSHSPESNTQCEEKARTPRQSTQNVREKKKKEGKTAKMDHRDERTAPHQKNQEENSCSASEGVTGEMYNPAVAKTDGTVSMGESTMEYKKEGSVKVGKGGTNTETTDDVIQEGGRKKLPVQKDQEMKMKNEPSKAVEDGDTKCIDGAVGDLRELKDPYKAELQSPLKKTKGGKSLLAVGGTLNHDPPTVGHVKPLGDENKGDIEKENKVSEEARCDIKPDLNDNHKQSELEGAGSPTTDPTTQRDKEALPMGHTEEPSSILEKLLKINKNEPSPDLSKVKKVVSVSRDQSDDHDQLQPETKFHPVAVETGAVPTPKPAVKETTPKPDAKKTTPKPDAKKTTPKPAAKETTPKPAAKKTTPKPAAKETTPKPAAKETTPKPAAKETTPKPAAKETTPKPAAKETTPKPSADIAKTAPSDQNNPGLQCHIEEETIMSSSSVCTTERPPGAEAYTKPCHEEIHPQSLTKSDQAGKTAQDSTDIICPPAPPLETGSVTDRDVGLSSLMDEADCKASEQDSATTAASPQNEGKPMKNTPPAETPSPETSQTSLPVKGRPSTRSEVITEKPASSSVSDEVIIESTESPFCNKEDDQTTEPLPLHNIDESPSAITVTEIPPPAPRLCISEALHAESMEEAKTMKDPPQITHIPVVEVASVGTGSALSEESQESMDNQNKDEKLQSQDVTLKTELVSEQVSESTTVVHSDEKSTQDKDQTVSETGKHQDNPKSRPLSELKKENILLQEKLKHPDMTKPLEAKPDGVSEQPQSVNVAQMLAAFDTPKKSPEKTPERKPSVRKDVTHLGSGQENALI
eukprot:XP_014016867.1 PREDICTED: proteoglycan 4-like [Salmo salar]